MTLLDEVEATLGVSFVCPDLLHLALTHGSWINESGGDSVLSNERLEFLGDAVLGLVVASWLYQRDPQASEGRLTSFRSALVRGETLARLARSLNLGRYLTLGHGEEQAGGRHREVNLANAVEAIIGALYLDQGLEAAQVLVRRLLSPILDEWGPGGPPQDDKSRLQELIQAQRRLQPVYALLGAEGPDHDRVFAVRVMAGEDVLGQGQGRNRRAAEMEAARDALVRFTDS